MKTPISSAMRALVFSSLFCLVSSLSLKAQFVTIPDANFVNWLNTNGYSQCMNGNQMNTTCSAVVNDTLVDCANANISNLTGIQYFTGLKSLKCSNNLLTALPTLPFGLQALYCNENQLTSLPALPGSLEWLECSGNQLTALPSLPINLYNLTCRDNQLSSLPNLPVTLVILECDANQLTSLPSLPASLTILSCTNNELNTLPALPNLTHLMCTHNQITSLPALPSTLIHFWCFNNLLTSLPAIPNGVTTLLCHHNQLTSLPPIHANMIQLRCEYNQLTSLPALANLGIIYCYNNQLTSLPALPSDLVMLYCSFNQLTSLPPLPNALSNLQCTDNQLTSLPALPASLGHLICSNNQLTSLPVLPDSLGVLHIKGNPIPCLPELKHIWNLNFTNTGITCLPEYGEVVTSEPPLQFVPLCNAFNNNGCQILWNIAGNAFFDVNNNCIKNAADTAQRNIKVQLWSGGSLQQTAITGGEGFYSFDVGYGNYEVRIDTSNSPFDVQCPVGNLLYDTITVIDSFDYSKDFALKCKPGFDLAAWSIYGARFRPANYTDVRISAGDLTNFHGVHCAAGIGGSVQLVMSGAVSYISPSSNALTPSTVSGNTITWNIADFGAVNFFSDFNIIVQTDTLAPLGSQVCFTASVTPTSGDNNPANNSLTQCFAVVGSYDPNDKQAYPVAEIDTAQEWLTYTVRFQNTGTAEAQHIYIDDTLDTDLDESSFQLLGYSYEPLVQIKDRFVRFNFPNINLPDSTTNEPESHGYVQYKVKLKENLPVGTQIKNTAYIYFDFNAPVVTNTTLNTISLLSSIPNFQPLNFSLYPNPASHIFSVTIPDDLIGSTLFITDITGKSMMIVQLQTENSNLETVGFSNGIYFVTLQTQNGNRSTKKLIINK